MRSGERGVTLIELLVGLIIVSFAAGVVVMSAPPRRPPAREEAERFAARVTQALDEVVFSGVDRRLEWTDADYRIARRDGDDWRMENASRPARRNVSFSIALDGAIADNADALNGGAGGGAFVGYGGPGFGTALGETANEADADADREGLETLALDPLGLAAGFDARFEDRRSAFIVSVRANGEIDLARE